MCRRRSHAAKADKNSTEAGIADLQVQLKNANIELHRADQLQKAGVQTQEQLDTAHMNADSLKAKIELAKTQVAAVHNTHRRSTASR